MRPDDYRLNDPARKVPAGIGRSMRNAIFAMNLTLNGCCDHTKQSIDEERLEYFVHLTREVDVQVFGRKTYELMSHLGLTWQKISPRLKPTKNSLWH
jgi:hypothetical protein